VEDPPKTALEALVCGLKVINWRGMVIEGLPMENHPENVVKLIFEKCVDLLDVMRDKKKDNLVPTFI